MGGPACARNEDACLRTGSCNTCRALVDALAKADNQGHDSRKRIVCRWCATNHDNFCSYSVSSILELILPDNCCTYLVSYAYVIDSNKLGTCYDSERCPLHELYFAEPAVI